MIYHLALSEEWSADLCSQFADYDDYQKRAVGAVVLYRGELVSGASTYAVFDGGIEIQIDTKTGYRRRGLATASAAALILECMERNLYPSWDAANPMSAALAKKLGYIEDSKYAAYEQGE